MKYEWKKQAKELYLPKNKPEIVMVPSMNSPAEKLQTVLRFKVEKI